MLSSVLEGENSDKRANSANDTVIGRAAKAVVCSELHKGDGPVVNEVIIDSTTMKVHRHGGGHKGGSRLRGCPGQA